MNRKNRHPAPQSAADLHAWLEADEALTQALNRLQDDINEYRDLSCAAALHGHIVRARELTNKLLKAVCEFNPVITRLMPPIGVYADALIEIKRKKATHAKRLQG